MRRLSLLLLFAVGCGGSPAVAPTDRLSPEWPQFGADEPVDIDAPRWVEEASTPEQRHSLVETQANVFLTTYQHTWSRADGPTCRFRPTCSAFARQAVSLHGVPGIFIAMGRLQRAHTHDAARYEASGRNVVDDVVDYSFWFEPTGDSRWKWHEHVESTR